MPRTAGLSGSSRVWFMRRKPSDSTVALISGLAPIALFTSVALSILSATRRSVLGRGYRLRSLVGGGQALADHLVDLAAAQLGHLRRRLQLLERSQRRAHGVDRVVGAVRFGQDVLDAGGLDDRAHRAARDDARTWSGRLEHDPRSAQLEADLMRDRGADHRHGDHVALGDLHALADRLCHLASLADAGTDSTVHVADDDQRAERELATALDDLGDSVDANDAVGKLRTLAC